MQTNKTYAVIWRLVLAAVAIYLFFYYGKEGAMAYMALAAGILMLLTAAIKARLPNSAAANKNVEVSNSTGLKEELKNGVIIDVRTPKEYASGHIPGSINIPLNTLSARKSELTRKYKTIITCCASGMRSASAKNILSGTQARIIDGGGWRSLQKQI